VDEEGFEDALGVMKAPVGKGQVLGDALGGGPAGGTCVCVCARVRVCLWVVREWGKGSRWILRGASPLNRHDKPMKTGPNASTNMCAHAHGTRTHTRMHLLHARVEEGRQEVEEGIDEEGTQVLHHKHGSPPNLCVYVSVCVR
jgi:hypothetical protein